MTTPENKQFYFLVYWDHDSGTWTVDNENCVVIMSDGTVYDEKAEEWSVLPEELERYDQERCYDLMERLRK
jgi:hypothetical protein